MNRASLPIYGFDAVGRRKYELRDSDLGDAWSYDLSDQLATASAVIEFEQPRSGDFSASWTDSSRGEQVAVSYFASRNGVTLEGYEGVRVGLP